MCTLMLLASGALAAASGTGSGLAPVTSPTRSVRLNNYNNWFFGSDVTTDKAQIVKTLARKDNITFTELWPITASDVKAQNPNAKVYRLYDLMCKPTWDSDWNNPGNTTKLQCPLTRAEIDANDWWLRDRKGNIVKESENMWYLDPGKPGFKQAYLAALLGRMAGKGFDGISFDYWQPSIIHSSFAIKGGWFNQNLMPAAYQSDQDWYQKAWKPFIEYVMTGVKRAGNRIIGNCVGEYNTSDPKGQFQRSLVDGVIYEQWAVDWPQTGGGWLRGSVIEQRINAMASDPLEVWTVDYGLQPTFPDYDRKRMVSLAMYYIAVPSNQDKRSYNYIGNRKVFWDPLWDFSIGTPVASAVKTPGKYFWSRMFSDGIVLMNYEEAASFKYDLDREYRDSNGKSVVGTIIVGPRSAMILSAISGRLNGTGM